MKILITVAILLFGYSAIASAEGIHTKKQVDDISVDHRPCLFFKLVGVAEADPVVAGQWWFTVPRTHTAYREILNLLVTARVATLPVSVTTTGNIVCDGHAEVSQVRLEGP